jgi:nucleotide-binding universal stress UspA family protein
LKPPKKISAITGKGVNTMKILVGYDDSNVAKEALALAKKHAKTFGASVEIVTSMTKGTESEREDIEKAERSLEYVKGLFIEENISCNTHLLIRGLSPGEDIVEFAKENNVDEIIVGVKRRSKVGKILMGSTAQYVILKAHCPVVSVK